MPETGQPPRPGKIRARAFVRVACLAASGLLAALLTGCDPSTGDQSASIGGGGPGMVQPQQGIYGIYEGPDSDYGGNPTSGTVVDNGFEVDGVTRAAPVQAPKTPPSQKADALASNQDTLAGGGDDKDSLTGEANDPSNDNPNDPTKPKSTNQDAEQTTTKDGKKTDALDSDEDGLDSDQDDLASDNGSDPLTGGADMGLNNGLDTSDRSDNYYTYKLRGLLTNANLVIFLNGSPIVVNPGGQDEDISPLVHHGMNRISFEYTPVDDTSRARNTIDRFSNPPLPSSATFDSYYDKSTNPDQKTVIVTQYFIGE